MSRMTLTEEQKAAICARYAQTESLRGVASEFGISPMRVKRLWDGLSEVQRQEYRGEVIAVREDAATQIMQGETVGDYLQKVIRARNSAIEELCSRLTDTRKRAKLTDKNLIAACKILHDMVSGNEKSPSEPNNIFIQLNSQVHDEINHYYIHDDDGTKERDDPGAGPQPGRDGLSDKRR